MQSLETLSADKILSLLPNSCIETLINRYYQNEKVYDLTTFVEWQQSNSTPQDCWYFVFGDEGVFIGAFTQPPSQRTCQPYIVVSIYCLPRSGYNQLFYYQGPQLKSDSIIYATSYDTPPDDFPLYLDTTSIIKESQGNLFIWGLEKVVEAIYFVPSI